MTNKKERWRKNSDEQLSPIGETNVPVSNRMLRRLKKAKSISELCPGSEAVDSEIADGDDLEKPGLESANCFDGFEEEDGMPSDLEGLGVEDEVTARKVLDFDSVPEFNPTIEDLGEKGKDGISVLETREEIRVSETTEEDEKEPPVSVPEFDSALEELGEIDEDQNCDMESGEEIRVSETMEVEKEQPVSVPEFDSAALDELDEKDKDQICDLEAGEEIGDSETKEAGKKRTALETSDSEGKESKRDKKRKKKSDDFDELPISSASLNMTKKERREYLDQLRAENQRLL